MSEATVPGALAECASCGHKAPAAEMIADLTPSWVPTGKRVCRDADACFTRRLARDRERFPVGALRDRSDALRSDGEETRYCAACRMNGNDDSKVGTERVWNVEGAGPDGVLAEVCENGHMFEIGDSDEEED